MQQSVPQGEKEYGNWKWFQGTMTITITDCIAFINPSKRSGIRWLRFEVLNAIQI